MWRMPLVLVWRPFLHALWLAPAAALACSIPNPAFDPAGSDGSAAGSTSSNAAEATGAPADASTADDELDGTTTPDAETTDDPPAPSDETSGCVGAIDDAAYAPCNEDAECPESGTCAVVLAPDPTTYALSVCEPSCAADCECPTPSQGTAEARCEQGRCALDCTDDRTCLPGMACVEGRCQWSHAYGECDDTCPVPGCFVLEDEQMQTLGHLCPVIDCFDELGVADHTLCPPPPTGDATPLCFADNGWCVLLCDGGQACPDGAECVNGWCFYPP